MIDIALVNAQNERVVSGTIEYETISKADSIKWKGVLYKLHTVDDYILTFKEVAFDVDVTNLLIRDDTITVEFVGADGTVHATGDMPRSNISVQIVKHSGRIYTLQTMEMRRLIYREFDPDLDLTSVIQGTP